MIQELLGIIPARGSSKGILGKNLKPLNGKPLIQYTIEACHKSKLLSDFIVSTDDPQIAEFAEKFNAIVPYLRPDYLATDNSKVIDSVLYTLDRIKKIKEVLPKYIVLLQPTSPFRNHIHLDESISMFQSSLCDTLVSVQKVPHNFIPESIYQLEKGELKPYLNENELLHKNRQDKPVYFARNGPAILISSVSSIMRNNTFYGEKILPFEMDTESSLDIDDEYDWRLAQAIIKCIN